MVDQVLITAMDQIDNRIYAVGEFGIIIYSDDFGENWLQAESVPFTNTLTDISCISINRCWATGKPRGVYRDFGLCRNQLRQRAHNGELPGVVKSSW